MDYDDDKDGYFVDKTTFGRCKQVNQQRIQHGEDTQAKATAASNGSKRKVIPMASYISTHNKTNKNCPRETIYSANNKDNSTPMPCKTSSHITQLEQQHKKQHTRKSPPSLN
jgi:hypothetical protein